MHFNKPLVSKISKDTLKSTSKMAQKKPLSTQASTKTEIYYKNPDNSLDSFNSYILSSKLCVFSITLLPIHLKPSTSWDKGLYYIDAAQETKRKKFF